jgi:hypothetical protein
VRSFSRQIRIGVKLCWGVASHRLNRSATVFHGDGWKHLHPVDHVGRFFDQPLQPTRLFQTRQFRFLSLRDVDAGADIPEKSAIVHDPGVRLVRNPPIGAIGAANTVLERERLTKGERLSMLTQEDWPVLDVNVVIPAGAKLLNDRPSREDEPSFAYEDTPAVGIGNPEHDRAMIDERTEERFWGDKLEQPGICHGRE